MNREIKFRGKRFDNGEWVYGYLVISESAFNKNQCCIIESKNHFQVGSTRSGNLCYSETDSRVHVVDPETVGEYAGLKDKNGKEVYDGDVISTAGIYEHGFIKYLGCSFMIEWIGADCYSDLLGWDDFKRGKISDGSDFEVIGNIY